MAINEQDLVLEEKVEVEMDDGVRKEVAARGHDWKKGIIKLKEGYIKLKELLRHARYAFVPPNYLTKDTLVLATGHSAGEDYACIFAQDLEGVLKKMAKHYNKNR